MQGLCREQIWTYGEPRVEGCGLCTSSKGPRARPSPGAQATSSVMGPLRHMLPAVGKDTCQHSLR